jgi:dihydroxyacetone kinase-like protein
MQAGMQFNEAAGSTIGILIFSAMMEAGKTSARFESIGLKELCEMLAAAIEGIEKRGKVEPGQKTIVDSLVSAHREFERLLDEGNTDPSEVTQPVLEAAEEGAEQTKEMKSAIGRARWFADRSIGVVDPGAVSGKLIIETFAEYITQQ